MSTYQRGGIVSKLKALRSCGVRPRGTARLAWIMRSIRDFVLIFPNRPKNERTMSPQFCHESL
jgi:hypothetical protein